MQQVIYSAPRDSHDLNSVYPMGFILYYYIILLRTLLYLFQTCITNKPYHDDLALNNHCLLSLWINYVNFNTMLIQEPYWKTPIQDSRAQNLIQKELYWLPIPTSNRNK